LGSIIGIIILKDMTKLFVIIIVVSLSFPGCAAPVVSTQKSNLTSGMAKTTIIEGKTSQNDILEVFGAPNIITRNKSGNEVWTYDKVSVERSSSEKHGTIIIAGMGASRGSTSSRTFTLMIEFDQQDLVESYTYRSSVF
jgi:hypothetical protein